MPQAGQNRCSRGIDGSRQVSGASVAIPHLPKRRSFISCVAASLIGLTSLSSAAWASGPLVVDEKFYATGTMNGVRLRIPKVYFLSAIHYHPGTEALSGFDRQIDIFDLRVRLSNFEPVVTDRDRQDWNLAMSRARPIFWETWLTVDFDNRYPLNWSINKDMPDGLRKDPAHWGPFVRDRTRPYGLVHYDSVQTVDNSPDHNHWEYYYDEASLTNIVCETSRIKVPPFDTYDHCDHRFLIPRLHVMAGATYGKKDLPRWREIELRITQIGDSFIVNN